MDVPFIDKFTGNPSSYSFSGLCNDNPAIDTFLDRLRNFSSKIRRDTERLHCKASINPRNVEQVSGFIRHTWHQKIGEERAFGSGEPTPWSQYYSMVLRSMVRGIMELERLHRGASKSWTMRRWERGWNQDQQVSRKVSLKFPFDDSPESLWKFSRNFFQALFEVTKLFKFSSLVNFLSRSLRDLRLLRILF